METHLSSRICAREQMTLLEKPLRQMKEVVMYVLWSDWKVLWM
jgi:hypothetical protein